MSPSHIKTGAKTPQTTPHRLELLASSLLGVFGSRWNNFLVFLGKVRVPRGGSRDILAVKGVASQSTRRPLSALLWCASRRAPFEPDQPAEGTAGWRRRGVFAAPRRRRVSSGLVPTR